MNKNYHYKPSKFYMLRTPYLSVEEYQNDKLLSNNSPILESILVSSTSLYEALQNTDKIEQKTKISFTKYQIRSSTRATPFGLFSGVSLGQFGEKTDMCIGNSSEHLKRLRIDMEWLRAIIKKVQKDRTVLPHLRMKYNEQCYIKGNRLYNPYMALTRENGETDMCASLRNTSPVEQVKSICKDYKSFHEIMGELLTINKNADTDKITNFLINLLENEILITELRPPLINTDPAQYLYEILNAIPAAGNYASQIKTVRESIDLYNKTSVGEGATLYINIVDQMKKLAECKHYLQTDLKINAKKNVLHSNVAGQAEKIANILTSIASRSFEYSHIKSYKADFIDKYGYDAEIPLLQILDEDIGLGAPAGYLNPPGNRQLSQEPPSHLSQKIQNLIIRKMETCQGDIVLKDEDFEKILQDESPFEIYEMPDSLEMYFEIIADEPHNIDEGNFLLHICGCRFSLGAGKSFGRFSDLITEGTPFNQELLTNCSLSQEDDEIIAEIHELPTTSRVSNVTLNINPFEYQIALSTNGCDGKTNIPVTDIYIGVDSDRNLFYAKSRQLNKKIKIKCSHMLTPYSASNACRFLRDISIHCRANPLDAIMEMDVKGFCHTPRILYDKTIIRPSQWKFNIDDLGKVTAESVKDLLKAYQVPDLFYYVAGDNRLLLDIDNPYHVMILADYLKKEKELLLTESIHNLDALFLEDSSGRKYVNEVVVPLYSMEKPEKKPAPNIPPSLAVLTNPLQQIMADEKRILFPGEEDWLYLKMYGFGNRENEFLGENLLAKVEEWKQRNIIAKHFFIRYADPKAHFRIRFQRNASIDKGVFFAEVSNWIVELKQMGFASKIIFDTYERETSRYGGDQLIETAETFFDADSNAVEEIFRETRSGMHIEEDYIGILGFKWLMQGFGLTMEDMHYWLGYNSSDNEYRALCKENKDRYLHLLLLDEQEMNTEEKRLSEIFRKRHASVLAYKQEIDQTDLAGALSVSKESILRSLLHMFCNRYMGKNIWEKKIYHLIKYSIHAFMGYKKHISKT